MKTGTLLVLTTCDGTEEAERLARGLVESRLAACVSAIGGVESTYRWNGKIERASENMLLIKTTSERYPALETFIRQNCGYDVPEILAVDVEAGFTGYLEWVRTSVEG